MLRVLTMNDRELLERAAKAAGVQLAWNMSVLPNGRPYPVNAATGEFWNPLADDGAALRLAVKLGITPYLAEGSLNKPQCAVWLPARMKWHYETAEDNDPRAATRRAIVRAAAAFADSEPT